MSDHLEHTRRWQHHQQPRASVDRTARDTETLAEAEHDARFAALSDEAVAVAEAVWTEDEPTLAEYELTERILAARIEQARAGEGALREALTKAAVVAHKGPNHTDAGIMRLTARDLRGGYDLGGSNRRAAVARVLDVVAAVLADTAGDDQERGESA